MARGLQGAGIQTALIEPGEAGARNAWQSGVRPVICSTLQQSGFSDASLGGVGAFDVVEHIENDLEFLQSMRACIKPGGRVFITVPAYKWLWSSEDVDAGHYRRYTPASLCRVMQNAGFQVEYCTGLFAWLPLPIAIFRASWSPFGITRKNVRDKLKADHRLPGGMPGQLLRSLLEAEFKRIAGGQRMPIGSSLLAVGRVSV